MSLFEMKKEMTKPIVNKNEKIELDDSVFAIIYKIKNTQGTKAKLQLLEDNKYNEELKQILKFAFDPYIVSGISESKYYKQVNISEPKQPESFIELLDYLKEHNTGKDTDIKIIQNYVFQGIPEWKSIIMKDIICKSLSIGINAKSINKVFPNLIEEYEVQQGFRVDDQVDNLDGKKVIVTQKYDGLRCSCRVENHQVILYSRNGQVYEDLYDLENELKQLPDGMYDGELLKEKGDINLLPLNKSNCIYAPEDSKELFKETTSIVNSNLPYKRNIGIWLYDFTPLENFDQHKQYNNPVEWRKAYIYHVRRMYDFKYVHIAPIIYDGIFDYKKIQEMLDKILEYKQEGLMINVSGSPYEFKRSKYMLKVKRMYPIDLRVINVMEGTGINKDKLGAVLVKYKGYDVKVGSGFTKEQRERYWKDKSLILNHIIELKYFEETCDKQGNISLRFPIFVQVRFDKDEESYN